MTKPKNKAPTASAEDIATRKKRKANIARENELNSFLTEAEETLRIIQALARNFQNRKGYKTTMENVTQQMKLQLPVLGVEIVSAYLPSYVEGEYALKILFAAEKVLAYLCSAYSLLRGPGRETTLLMLLAEVKAMDSIIVNAAPKFYGEKQVVIARNRQKMIAAVESILTGTRPKSSEELKDVRVLVKTDPLVTDNYNDYSKLIHLLVFLFSVVGSALMVGGLESLKDKKQDITYPYIYYTLFVMTVLRLLMPFAYKNSESANSLRLISKSELTLLLTALEIKGKNYVTCPVFYFDDRVIPEITIEAKELGAAQEPVCRMLSSVFLTTGLMPFESVDETGPVPSRWKLTPTKQPSSEQLDKIKQTLTYLNKVAAYTKAVLKFPDSLCIEEVLLNEDALTFTIKVRDKSLTQADNSYSLQEIFRKNLPNMIQAEESNVNVFLISGSIASPLPNIKNLLACEQSTREVLSSQHEATASNDDDEEDLQLLVEPPIKSNWLSIFLPKRRTAYKDNAPPQSNENSTARINTDLAFQFNNEICHLSNCMPLETRGNTTHFALFRPSQEKATELIGNLGLFTQSFNNGFGTKPQHKGIVKRPSQLHFGELGYVLKTSQADRLEADERVILGTHEQRTVVHVFTGLRGYYRH